MDVAIVGMGRVGTALSVLLSRAGHRVVEEPSEADLVVIATPDDRIADVCSELAADGAFRSGQFVAHVSGATGLDALAPAGAAGAKTVSLHPLQTFPDADAAIERVSGSALAVTAEDDAGYEFGERIAADLGAGSFRLPDQAKPLYHAAAVFASNYVVTVLALADTAFRAAGIDEPIPLAMPLVETTVAAVERLGPDRALTGPAVRGDAGTIRANLEALGSHVPQTVDAYVALAAAALDLAERSGRLSGPDRIAVEEVLAQWR